jgi:hypothetical protein
MNVQPQAPAPANDPWAYVQPKPKYVPIPVGQYNADFKGVEDAAVPAGEGDDGKRWRFRWTVATGQYAGKEAGAMTGRSTLATRHSGRLIEGLVGRPLAAGDNVKALVDAAIGKRFMVSVQAGSKGGKPSVQHCFPAPPAGM